MPGRVPVKQELGAAHAGKTGPPAGNRWLRDRSALMLTYRNGILVLHFMLTRTRQCLQHDYRRYRS